MNFEEQLNTLKDEISKELSNDIPTYKENYDTAKGAVKPTQADLIFAIIHINKGTVNAFQNESEVINVIPEFERLLVLATYYDKLIHDKKDDLDNKEALLDFSQDLLNHIVQLLIEKNHDYGSSYYKVAKVLGPGTSFSVRLLDKGNRLEQFETLYRNGLNLKVKDESVSDTIRDLLGYYLLYMITVRTMKRG